MSFKLLKNSLVEVTLHQRGVDIIQSMSMRDFILFIAGRAA